MVREHPAEGEAMNAAAVRLSDLSATELRGAAATLRSAASMIRDHPNPSMAALTGQVADERERVAAALEAEAKAKR